MKHLFRLRPLADSGSTAAVPRIAAAAAVLLFVSSAHADRLTNPVVDTVQLQCDDDRSAIAYPVAVAPSPGSGGDSPAGGGNRFLQRFDRNHDGKVTKEEFVGPPRRFGIVDKDGDGTVTREEAAAAPPPPGRRGAGSGAAPDGGRRQAPGVHPKLPPETGPVPGGPKKGSDPGKPSIIMILTDDMGWTGLSVGMDDRVENSASDFYQTPRVARLAEQGMRFVRAYAPAALCTPTRASILTGKTPARLHITTPGGGARPEAWQKLSGVRQLREFPTSETTTAEALREAGYATAHFGKWHLPRSEPGDHGFDFHDGETGNGGPGSHEDPNPKDIFGLTDRAITFIENQVAAGRPFYLHLSHYAVHEPTLALAASREKFGKLPSGERHNDVEFAAMTHDLDTGTGRLLDRLDQLGLAESTYVVFMSDNGAVGGRRRPKENLPLRGGKGGFYEGGIRVPMIVRGPGIEPKSICREGVVGYDLLPTFCGWAGVAPPEGIEGADLAPLLRGRSGQFKRPEPALLFHFPHYGLGPQVPESAIILGDYKLIKKHDSGTLELFNLASDLSEENELSQKEPEMLAKMEKELTRRLEEAKAQTPTPNPGYDPEANRPRQRRPGGPGERDDRFGRRR